MTPPFLSPVTGAPLRETDGAWTTAAGDERYPVRDGLPVLVPRPEAHLARLDALRASQKGDWYTADHRRTYDAGPYRRHVERRRALLRALVAEHTAFPPGSAPAAIDLGCGDGAASRWLMEWLPPATRWFLTDYNLERLARARRDAPAGADVTCFVSDITAPVLPENTFDVVFSHHVIEHVLDDRGVFVTAHRLLKPGGVFFLGCPNEAVFCWLLAYALSPATLRRSDHIHFYDAPTLAALARSAGLEPVRTAYVGYGVPHWGLDARLRRWAVMDDLFHFFGSRWARSQASSLYMVLKKAPA